MMKSHKQKGAVPAGDAAGDAEEFNAGLTGDPEMGFTGPDPAAHQELAKVSLDSQQIEELKGRAAKADEYWDRLLQQTADFDNYKKRAARERQEVSKYANESLLQKLVPVLDNFDMALAAANQPQATVESLRTGVGLIHNQLKSALMSAGLQELDATDQVFDPNWQEAVSQQESDSVPEGRVLQQLRKGYKLNERVIRPATVVVAKKPGA